MVKSQINENNFPELLKITKHHYGVPNPGLLNLVNNLINKQSLNVSSDYDLELNKLCCVMIYDNFISPKPSNAFLVKITGKKKSTSSTYKFDYEYVGVKEIPVTDLFPKTFHTERDLTYWQLKDYKKLL